MDFAFPEASLGMNHHTRVPKQLGEGVAAPWVLGHEEDLKGAVEPRLSPAHKGISVSSYFEVLCAIFSPPVSP